jgi:threonine/homoserine/homoserine lactone efflux protein
MPTFETLALFTTAAIVITLVPGPSMMYVMSRSIAHGRAAGICSAFGLATGLLIHTIAASLGLSVIFFYSPLTYLIIKYLGAIYLIYLGTRSLFTKEALHQSSISQQPINKYQVYTQGIITELLNPKTALFFLSFLPQFVDPLRGSTALQMFILGFILILTALTADLIIGITGGMMSTWFSAHPFIQKAQRWLAGTVLISLGVRLAFSER